MAASIEQQRVRRSHERSNEIDLLRAEVGRRHLSEAACEMVVREAMRRTPPALLERARTLLRRYFSARPWTLNDELSLATLVGRGEGWHEATLDHDLLIQFGWRGGGFNLMCGRAVRTDPDEAAARPHNARQDQATEIAAMAITIAQLSSPAHRIRPIAESLAATFATSVVPETTHDPTVVVFLVSGNHPTIVPGWVDRIQIGRLGIADELFQSADAIQRVAFETGTCNVQVRKRSDWAECLAPTIMLLDRLASRQHSVPITDRNAGRLREEFGGLALHSSAAIQRLRVAVLSRDPVERQLAVELFGAADPFAAPKVWRTAIDDSARNVRRAAAKAIAATRSETLRGLLERATHDVDSCTRFHAVYGLAMIGAQLSSSVLEPLGHDPDARVQVITALALRRCTC